MVAEAINIDVKNYPVVGDKWDVSFIKNFYGEGCMTPNFKSICNFTEASDGKFRIVYGTRNLITDKMYVGQHTTDNMDDEYIGSGVAFKDAVKSYGKENFKVRFCCFCEDQENLDRAEIAYIKYFDSVNKGYNLDDGGLVPTITKEIRDKISKANKGKIPWNKGKTGIYSEESLKKMGASKIGKKQTPEANFKRSKTLKGRTISKESIAKTVATKKERGIYKPLTEDQKENLRQKNLGKKQSNDTIAKRVAKNTGKKRSEEQKANLRAGGIKNLKKIIQKDLDGNFIKLWLNNLEILDCYPFNRNRLNNACNRKEIYRGFIWEYEKL